MLFKMRGEPSSDDQPFIFERKKPRAYEKPKFTQIFADDPKKCRRQQKFSDVIWIRGGIFSKRCLPIPMPNILVNGRVEQ